MKGVTSRGRPSRAESLIIVALQRSLRPISGAVSLALLNAGVSLMTPLLFKATVDRAIPSKDLMMLGWLLAAMTIVPVGQSALNSLQEYVRSVVGSAVANQLRDELFAHMLGVPLKDLEVVTSAQVVQRITRQCGRVGEVFVEQQAIPLLSNLALVVGTVGAMLSLNWQLGLLAILAFPPSFLISSHVGQVSRDLDKAFLRHLEKADSYLHDVFTNIKVVRAFNAIGNERQRWAEWLLEHKRMRGRIAVYHNLSRMMLSDVITNAVSGLIFGYGAIKVIEGSMSTGALIAFVSYLPKAYGSLRLLSNTRIEWERLRAELDAIDELLAMPQESDHFGTKLVPATPTASPVVEFRDVCFGYREGGFRLQNVSFAVRRGEFLGIVGPTGAGKSTLFDLLLGFYVPSCGSIRLNGVNIRELRLEEVRRHLAVIPQDDKVWRNSLSYNIAYPRCDVELRLIKEVVKAAQLEDLVSSLPDGLETEISERGTNLSGGECRRIAIARALLWGAPVILMDEATASLDALTELKLRNALKVLAASRTLLVIAHRLSAVLEADNIVVLDSGRVVEYGPPNELLNQKGLFYSLYKAQILASRDTVRE